MSLPSAPRIVVDVFFFVVHSEFEVGVLAPEESRLKIFLGKDLELYGATCCTCVSFAWGIVRDSPTVNFDSQTMTWSSVAKSMLPGNAKMLDDVIGGYQAYIQRKKDLFIYEASNLAAG